MASEGKGERQLRSMGKQSFDQGKSIIDSGDEFIGEGRGMMNQGAPMIAETVRRVMSAMLGGIEPVSMLPITARKRSAVATEGSNVRSNTEEELSRAGLRNSAFGMQQLEDVDRSVASMLADVDVGELEHLTRLGETLGLNLTQMGQQSEQLGVQTKGVGVQGMQAGMGGTANAAQLGAGREAQKLQIMTQLGSTAGMMGGMALAGPLGGMLGGKLFGTATKGLNPANSFSGDPTMGMGT